MDEADGRAARKVLVETWGCQMNVYDSERLTGQLRGLGYLPTDDEREADLILLNTCSVREKAAEKMFSRLGRLKPLKRARPDLLVGVAGCVAQQEKERILTRSSVPDFVLGPRATSSLPALLEQAARGRRGIDVAIRDDRYDELGAVERSVPHRAFLTVVEGCSKSCSFCIVPFTRGPEASRPLREIRAEATAALVGGASEVELLGQNVNAWTEGESRFADLLRAIDALPGLRRLRFVTSHPRELSDEVIGAMGDGEHVMNHLHLPVQSGSNSVLKRMHRGYDRDRYLSRVARLRHRVPSLALSSDIIIGFPGETDEEFRDTMRLLDEVEFDQVFGFVYSRRPHTRAAELEDRTPLEVKEQRLQELFARQEVISNRKNQAFVGRSVEVLVDGRARTRDGFLHGRTTDNRIVNFPGGAELTGQYVNVRIRRASPYSLVGDRQEPGHAD